MKQRGVVCVSAGVSLVRIGVGNVLVNMCTLHHSSVVVVVVVVMVVVLHPLID